MTPFTSSLKLLSLADARAMALAHHARATRWTEPAKNRRSRQQSHPVEDFLFTYYPYRLGKLEEWHPPVGSAIESSPTTPLCLQSHPYRQTNTFIYADPTLLTDKEVARLHWVIDLLERTAQRTPNFACHGLHEWAMVYRGTEIRHASTTPLRLPQAEIDALVESHPIRCSHFDAFRFFHPAARPLNKLQPDLLTRQDFEQPACIHANMDLYKWAFKSMPWPGSDLLFDTFELALELRDLDMRASPYDLSSYGLQPIPIETIAGRRFYEKEQARLAAKSTTIRQRLIQALRLTLEIARPLTTASSGPIL